MKSASFARLLIGSVAATGLLAACGSDSSSAPASSPATSGAGHPVTIKGFAFAPADVTVPVGTAVTWTNQDSTLHTATSVQGAPAAFDSGNLDSGKSYTYTFAAAGKYSYHCSIHSNMLGTVTVQ